MSGIDPVVQDIIRSKIPNAHIVDTDVISPAQSAGARKAVKAEAMIAKWSSPQFIQQAFAEADGAPYNTTRHVIDFAVIEVDDDFDAGSKRRQTVIVDKTAGEIIAVSG
ncbi:hypothetical protein [Stenotrophomonas hibiscicola]